MEISNENRYPVDLISPETHTEEVQVHRAYSGSRGRGVSLNTCVKLALPIIALLALSSIPSADGGPVAMAGCLVLCDGIFAASTGGWGPLVAHSLCVSMCAPFMAAPTP